MVLNWSSLSFCCLLTTMGENETSSSVQEMNIQEVKDFIAKEFQLDVSFGGLFEIMVKDRHRQDIFAREIRRY